MALNMAAERGLFECEWDAPVTRYWTALAQNGKVHITVRPLFNHRAGLADVDLPRLLADFCDPMQTERLQTILAAQSRGWTVDAEAFSQKVCGEPRATILHRGSAGPTGRRGV